MRPESSIGSPPIATESIVTVPQPAPLLDLRVLQEIAWLGDGRRGIALRRRNCNG
jgi:hypothetical protein